MRGHGIMWNHIPYGAEDQTGDKPLQERARWLRHTDFFIGLSSGLSWLAWAAGTPCQGPWLEVLGAHRRQRRQAVYCFSASPV